MKYSVVIMLALLCFTQVIFSQGFAPQGTTVKKSGCDVMLIIQIALDNDSTGDITMVQSALDACFSQACDLPCTDGKTGSCKIYTKAVVVKWSSLTAADQPKFHHVTMLSGSGVSFVNEVGVPNNGKSSGGSWYRKEYNPKVYCHEVMHLAGLDDHYRDCRANRLALGVDNCKDGDTCTAAQKASGACPSCHGYEDDIMGADVTKPIDCNRDIVEIIRIANDPLNPSFICSDSCCEGEHRTVNNHREIKKNDYFIGLTLIREDNGYDRFNTYGGEFSYTRNLCSRGGITGDAGFNAGSNGGVDFTKISILAGGTYYPIKESIPASDFRLSVHALGGLSSIKSSYGGSSSNSNSYFTMDLGIGLDYSLGNKLGIGLRAGYMPSFSNGKSSNNYRIGLGINYK